ncbi:hypothetical protein C8R47DRAFT_1087808 [Mycena vitilis]|nr:hypothetical protein C8R47DRAFT_1087808 [Mycena vitilis]
MLQRRCAPSFPLHSPSDGTNAAAPPRLSTKADRTQASPYSLHSPGHRTSWLPYNSALCTRCSKHRILAATTKASCGVVSSLPAIPISSHQPARPRHSRHLPASTRLSVCAQATRDPHSLGSSRHRAFRASRRCARGTRIRGVGVSVLPITLIPPTPIPTTSDACTYSACTCYPSIRSTGLPFRSTAILSLLFFLTLGEFNPSLCSIRPNFKGPLGCSM